MNSNKKNFDGTFIIFLSISVIYAIGNFIWWIINTPIIPINICAGHFLDVFLKHFFFNNAPLITWIMRGMFYVFGKEYYDLIVIFVNYIFFLIPLYFIYKIGTELKDKETGNIAMILFALVPAVYGMSRHYGHQDYHIIAGITFNIYCLIKTDYFRDRKWTIWYGISVGLGLMIKDAFLAYFFVPFAYIAIAGLREKIEKTKIINILISIAIGSLISGWHYFRFDIVKKILEEPTKEMYSSPFSFESLRVMTIGLWEELLSPPIFILFAVGLIYFIWKYKGEYKNVILLWFFVPWAIITFMPHHKMPEYGAGFIPVMIFVGTILISSIEKIYFKKTIVMLLIVICFLQYINFSYRIFNMGFFNFSFKVCERTRIKYYNRYNALMISNFSQVQFILKLTKYLKDNYPGEKYKIDLLSYPIDVHGLCANMLLHDMYCSLSSFDNENIFIADIIITFGYNKTIQDIVKLKVNEMLYNQANIKLITDELKKELTKSIQLIFEKIHKNYHVMDQFYIDSKKIILFGKKEQF